MRTQFKSFNFVLPASASVSSFSGKSVSILPNQLLVTAVLSGEISIKKHNTSKLFTEGNIAIMDSDVPFVIRENKENTQLLILTIDNSYYEAQFPHINSTLFCKPTSDKCNRLFPLVLDTALALMEPQPETYSIIDENLKSILKIILDDCQYFSDLIKNNFSNPNTQIEYIGLMQNILLYIFNNYTEKISLSAFAHQMYLSENYLSHLIKKISGASFKELLSFIRCRKSESMLINSAKRLGEISYLSGFSAPVYYKRSFEKFWGISPEEYRKTCSKQPIRQRLTDEGYVLDAKTSIFDFASKYNIKLSISSERFFTNDTVYVDHYIEYFKKVLSDEGAINNIDAEMNESSHGAFINMQKEFQMNIITIDASILVNKITSSNQLTIATNINYLIWSKFKVRFVIHSLSPNITSAIVRFMKFYYHRFNRTLYEIDFSIKANAPTDTLTRYKISLSEKLREEIGTFFNIEINTAYIQTARYFPYLYDSFVLTPFAMDELFHPENWKRSIDFSLIDAVSENGYILAGGIGLLTWNGIKKPWWHAYNLVSKLRGSIVSKGKDHIITNNSGIITILTYNTCGLPPAYLNSIKSIHELFDVIQNKGHIREHSFQLMNTFGKYKIITYTINEASCLFSKWANLGYPEYLTLEEEIVLSQICHPEVEFDTVESNGRIDITTKEDSFGVTCVVLKKIQ